MDSYMHNIPFDLQKYIVIRSAVNAHLIYFISPVNWKATRVEKRERGYMTKLAVKWARSQTDVSDNEPTEDLT